MKNRQHLVPRSRGGSNHPDNVPMWDIQKHDLYHRVFANMTPHEAIAHIVNLNRSVLREEFVQLIAQILAIQPEDIYQPQCVSNIKKLVKTEHDAIAKLLDFAGVSLWEPIESKTD